MVFSTVNGNYTEWTDWSTCSHSCGPGFMLRSRTCTNPPPSNGGFDCTRLGRPVQSTQCYLVDCPGKARGLQGGLYSFFLSQCSLYLFLFSAFSRLTPCYYSIAHSTMNFTAGLALAFPLFPLLELNNLYCFSVVDGNYTTWSNWTACSATCGEGTTTRTHSCTNPPPLHGGKDCTEIGSNIEIQPCKNQDCLGK